MADSYLGELLQIAVRIMELDAFEDECSDLDEWNAAKAEHDALETRFGEVTNEFINGLLDDEETRSTAVADIQADLSNLKERADPSWLPAIEYTEGKLLPPLRKEASKSPQLRKAIKFAPYILAAFGILAYFGARVFAATPISAELESRQGLVERASAYEKVVRYDDFMGTRVRRGGWLKGILFWPIEPNDAEIQGAAEFAGLVIDGQEYAQGCGVVTGYDDQLSDGQLSMVSEVAEYIRDDQTQWEDEPVLTVLRGLEQASIC